MQQAKAGINFPAFVLPNQINRYAELSTRLHCADQNRWSNLGPVSVSKIKLDVNFQEIKF